MGQASPGCTCTRSMWHHAIPVALIAVALTLSQGRLITPTKAQAEPDLPRAPPLAISREEAEPTPAWTNFCERHRQLDWLWSRHGTRRPVTRTPMPERPRR